MADILQFSRNTKCFIGNGTSFWEIPIMDGFSFTQSTNGTEIVLNEMASAAGVSRRARQYFNDSLAPAEWSFTSYMRPNGGANAAAGLSAVEEALWAHMAANANVFTAGTTPDAGTWSKAVDKSAADTVVIDFDDSNATTLTTFDLYFVLGGCGDGITVFNIAGGQTVYKIAASVVNTASIDFDIDGISSIVWSGFGSIITEEAELDVTPGAGTGLVDTSVSNTGTFIRNRLTQLGIVGVSPYSTAYTATLTGGNITIDNNITFLTPETLCTVNTPLGHVTGTRSVSGNFTTYLVDNTTDASGDLWEDLIGNTSVVTNSFDLTFDIGGNIAPFVQVSIPQAHMEVPAHSIEDVISLDVSFQGLPTTLDTADEILITYNG